MPSPSLISAPPVSFFRDILTLVTGTTIAYIITILAAPFITRLYGPEAFGLAALFTSITGIIGVVACLRYELAVVLPKSDKEAANVFGLCLFIVVLMSLVSIPFLIVVQEPLVQFLKAPQLEPFFWFIPPMIFLIGAFLALNYWNIRTKHFYRLAIAQVMKSCATNGIQLGMGFAGYTSGGVLIGANIIGQVILTFALGIQIMRDHFHYFKQNISRKGMVEAFKRYINFPKYDIWSALLNTISWQIPIFLLAYFFSTTIVGYYSLAMMMVQIPMSLVGSAISQVFFQRAVEAKNDRTLIPLVENIFELLIILGLFPMLVLSLIGGDLFSLVFSAKWIVAGYFTQIFALWAFVWFVSSPISNLILVFEKQRYGLYFNFFIFVTRVIAICIGGLMGNPYIAIALFSISGIFVYGYLTLYCLDISGVTLRKVFKIILSAIRMLIPFIIIIVIFTLIAGNPLINICISFLISIIYYFYVYRIRYKGRLPL
jgi:lipopolysaccharide exporter